MMLWQVFDMTALLSQHITSSSRLHALVGELDEGNITSRRAPRL
jgi:hypothetical protein